MTYNLWYQSNNGNSIFFSLGSGIIISDIDGLTAVNSKMSTSQGISQVGESISGISVQGKLITITGFILGATKYWRKHLIDTIVPNIRGRLIFNEEWFIDVEVENSPDISRENYGAKFQFTVRAGYPYWQSTQETSVMLSGLVGKHRFMLNYGDPAVPDYHNFGMNVIEEYGNAKNTGNVPVPFRVVFRAITPVENPKVINIETLEIVGLEKQMAAGEMVVIDMTKPMLTVISTNALRVSKDDFASLEIKSTIPFLLRQGDNLLKQDADLGREMLQCRVFFRTAIVGPYF